ILDIFAQHAHTHEGALQVELAQYEYRLPRLTRMWTHLARQVGGGAARGGPGGVGLRGPGETQLEVDRREIKRRIAHLKQELEEVRTHRRLYRQRRRKAQLAVVAIVGYTNAGKSTLLNAISGSQVHVEDKLFATLDPTTRRVQLPDGREALFTDTVGFIQKLPTQLVAAFRATLEEINEADVILNIVDISHPNVREQTRAVEEILRDLGVTDTPMVVGLNKIDLLPGMDGGRVEDLIDRLPPLRNYPNTIPISAARGIGLDRLLARISQVLARDLVPITVVLPYKQDGLLTLFHQRGVVQKVSYTPQGVRIAGKLPRSLQAHFAEYIR
ncbi:MAG: GTPase HflX, partial [Chloroflexi bacterium]|nr:GTPase HflX [Chloroflexota bacterium]